MTELSQAKDSREAYQRLTIYEPRWHGWAAWERELRTPVSGSCEMVLRLERGWMRRERGAEYVTFRSDPAAVGGGSGV